MQTLDVYLPDDLSNIPQYKVGDLFYRVDNLQRVAEDVSSTVFRMYPHILNSTPLLIREINTREWILLDTNRDELRILGNSSNFTQVGPFLRPIQLTIPNHIENGARLGPIRFNLQPFDPRIKNVIEHKISSNRPLPTPDSTVAMNSSIDIYFARSIEPSDIPRTENLQSNVVTQNQSEKQIHQLSYEILTKQLYGLPVIIPEHLILNGLKVNFIPFSQINTIQIERYIIEPLLQPWAGPPSTQNRILTIFGTDGITYLVKAKYDQISSQIFPPI